MRESGNGKDKQVLFYFFHNLKRNFNTLKGSFNKKIKRIVIKRRYLKITCKFNYFILFYSSFLNKRIFRIKEVKKGEKMRIEIK